jgi:putative tryptophan/tyrosine transport system substrate-binding protein
MPMHIRRREFIVTLGTAAAAWPMVARTAAKRPRIAVLTLLSRRDEGGRIADFVTGLRELGYIEGRNLDMDYRYADGDTEQLNALARELTALAPDVIYAGEPSAARAVKAAAPDLPIVCPVLSDRLPDLFASYARPGGSVTGMASIVEGLNGKQVELVLEVVPATMRIGVLVNPTGANRDFVMQQTEAAARARGVTTLVEPARRPENLRTAFEQFAKAQAQAVIVAPNGMFINQRRSIVEFALAARLPTIFQDHGDVQAGGLASYGVDERDNRRRAALFVDKILKGARPGDLPIEFPTKLLLAVNLKTAKALGITIPAAVLARADEVIE